MATLTHGVSFSAMMRKMFIILLISKTTETQENSFFVQPIWFLVVACNKMNFKFVHINKLATEQVLRYYCAIAHWKHYLWLWKIVTILLVFFLKSNMSLPDFILSNITRQGFFSAKNHFDKITFHIGILNFR